MRVLTNFAAFAIIASISSTAVLAADVSNRLKRNSTSNEASETETRAKKRTAREGKTTRPSRSSNRARSGNVASNIDARMLDDVCPEEDLEIVLEIGGTLEFTVVTDWLAQYPNNLDCQVVISCPGGKLEQPDFRTDDYICVAKEGGVNDPDDDTNLAQPPLITLEPIGEPPVDPVVPELTFPGRPFPTETPVSAELVGEEEDLPTDVRKRFVRKLR